MIKFYNDKGIVVWINPDYVILCSQYEHNYIIELHCKLYGSEFPTHIRINQESYVQLTTGNRLINAQEQELIRQANERALND